MDPMDNLANAGNIFEKSNPPIYSSGKNREKGKHGKYGVLNSSHLLFEAQTAH